MDEATAPLPPADRNQTPGTEFSAQLTPGNELRRLGPYEIGATLGWGGMGIVYRAIDTRSGQAVALKVLRLDQEPSSNTLRRFQKEIEAATGLDHPGIVRVLGSGIDHEIHYCAMELIEGRTLNLWASERERSIVERISMIATIARAVHYAHQSGIIHRDLKPGNVIVTADGDRPYVADFGLARAIGSKSSLTKSEDAIGTPSYMSPEQARGQHRKCDARTDVWALGVMLYELLVGAQPFQGESALDVMAGIVNRDPAPPRDINPALRPPLERVIMQCLDKDADRRYASANDLAEDLERVLEGRSVRARRFGWRQRHRSAIRRLALPLLAALLGLGLLTMATLWQYGSYHQRYGRWVEVVHLDLGDPDTDLSQLRFIAPDLHTEVEPWSRSSKGLSMAREQWLWLRDVRITSDLRFEAVVKTGQRVDGIDFCISSQLPDQAQRWALVPTGYSCQFGGFNGLIDFIAANPKPQYPDRLISSPSTLQPDRVYHLQFQRDGDAFSLWIDGELRLEATLPLPLSGNNLSGIGLRTWSESLEIREIRISRLAPGEAASPLLAGETMARFGHTAEAVDEFRSVAAAHSGSAVASRALAKAFVVELAAKARPDVIEDLDARLQALGAHDPYRQAAQSAMASHLWQHGDYDLALDRIENLLHSQPQDRSLLRCLALGSNIQDRSISRRIGDLLRQTRGVTILEAGGVGLEDLDCLAHLDLYTLNAAGNPIASLEPLRGMRLHDLNLAGTGISDLSALSGMPLRRLDLTGNLITDLEPLRGMPLEHLAIDRNLIEDLSPLADSPIGSLSAAENRIVDLEPLRGHNLRRLKLSDNLIQDASPLSGGRFGWVNLAYNQIAELTLRPDTRIKHLELQGNPLSDLAPLEPFGLDILDIHGLPIEDLDWLTQAPVERLIFGSRSLDPAKLDLTAASWEAAGRSGLAHHAAALAAFIRSDLPALRSLAQPVGGRSMTFIPVNLRWNDVLPTLHRLGGRLPRISSAAQQDLSAWIDPPYRIWIDLYLGTQGLVHLDGSPVDFHLARSGSLQETMVSWQGKVWWAVEESHECSLLVEWPEASSPQP